MIKIRIGNRAILEDIELGIIFTFSNVSMIVLVIVLPLAGAVIARLLDGSFGHFGWYLLGGFLGALITAIIFILQQDELAAVLILGVSLYVDFYDALYVLAPIMAIALLVFIFLRRSRQYPWVEPKALGLWLLFLILTILPSIRGALDVIDALDYYPNIILGALVMFWLGLLLGRDIWSLRRFFTFLAVYATLIATHTILQDKLGSTFLQLQHASTFLTNVTNYQLGTNVGVYRSGSFFIDPNWDGTFLAATLFIPLGLFFESSHFLKKIFYLAMAFVILIAMLFTYSAGASIAALAGIPIFILLLGHMGERILFSIMVILLAVIILVYFPTQISLLLQHGSDPSELAIRGGAWQTALRVIQAFPLIGVGLGHQAYEERAEPYRVPAQIAPLNHPHNSYLEWGAMAGIPVLLVFLALILFALGQALHNWKSAEPKMRTLIGAGIAAIIVLSVNSWSIDGWTLPPIAAVGWMILGAIASPLLAKHRVVKRSKEGQEQQTSY